MGCTCIDDRRRGLQAAGVPVATVILAIVAAAFVPLANLPGLPSTHRQQVGS